MDPAKDINFKKVIFGTFFLIVLGVVVLWTKRSASQIILTAHQNKFNINFQISSRDKVQATIFLEKANLPQNILEGVQFTLDATSAARLAHITPVTAHLNFTKERLNFQGKATAALTNTTITPIANFQIPASTNLAIFAPDFTSLIKKKFVMPKDFQTWLDQNLASDSGQYLIIFGTDDFALVTKPSNPPDFAHLTAQSTTGEFYKQEITANLNFHLVKLPQGDKKEITLTFFEQGPLLFMTSSRKIAQELADVQKGISPTINFWPQGQTPVSAALLWQSPKSSSSQDLLWLLVGDDTRLASALAKIPQARLTIADQEFWGYFDFSQDK